MCQSIPFVLDLVPQLRIVESHNGPFCDVRDWAISDVEMLAASHCLRDPNDLMVLWSKTYSLQLPQSVYRNSIWQDDRQIIRYSGRVYQIQVFNCHGLSRVQGLQCWDAQKVVGVWGWWSFWMSSDDFRGTFREFEHFVKARIWQLHGIVSFPPQAFFFCVYAIGFFVHFFLPD